MKDYTWALYGSCLFFMRAAWVASRHFRLGAAYRFLIFLALCVAILLVCHLLEGTVVYAGKTRG